MPGAATQDQRDWALFVDWCQSIDADPLPASADTIAAFLAAFPASIRAHGRRIRAIRHAHEHAHLPFEILTENRTATTLREGDEWVSIPEALAQVPKYQHRKHLPIALRGRRDAWLLVLLGVVGLSRAAARDLVADDVALFPRLAIRSTPIVRTTDAPPCPACAVTRWLRVVGPAAFHYRSEIAEAVSPEADAESVHDCTLGLDGLWRQAPTLLPAIDQHGWTTSAPMSARAISTTMRLRQQRSDPLTSEQHISSRSTGRFAAATSDELAAAYDDVDERLAALLLRTSQMLKDSEEMLDRVTGIRR